MGGKTLRYFNDAVAAGDVHYNAGVPYDSRGALLIATTIGTKTALKGVAIGDSMTARDEGARASGLNGPRSDGINTIAEMLLGGSVEITGIYATGGYTIAQVATNHLPTALASDADVVFAMCGVNDCITLGSDTGATIYARLKTQIIDPIIASGKKLILGTITYSADMNAASRGAMVVCNNMIRALEGTIQNLQIAETNGVMSAALDGVRRTAPTACYDDNTHQNQAGAYWMAVEVVNAYKRHGALAGNGRCRKPVANAYGIATNPRIAGNNATGTNKTSLGTGISGTGPDGWTVNRSGSTNTAASSSVARTDNQDGLAHQLEITLTAAGEPINVYPASGGALFIRGTGTTFQRQNSTATYIQGEVRRFTDGRMYKVVGLGTTAASEPGTLPTLAGDVVVDGTVIWMLLPDFVGDATWAMRFVADYQITAQSGLLAPIAQLRQYATGYAVLSSGVMHYDRTVDGFVAAGPSGSNFGVVYGPAGTNLSAGYNAVEQNKVITMRTPWARLHADTHIIEPQIRFAGAAGTTATVQILGAEIELAQIA